eukprot:Colp12_sorted_trinity150504_noHs@19609
MDKDKSSLSIVTADHVANHDGLELFNQDLVTKHLEMPDDVTHQYTPAKLLKWLVTELNLNGQEHRLWTISKRQNGTRRVYSRLDGTSAMDRTPPRHVYVQKTPEAVCNQPLFIFVKYYSKKNKGIVFTRELFINQTQRVSELLPVFRGMAGLAMDANVIVYEYIRPELMERLDLGETVYNCELMHGDILIFEEGPCADLSQDYAKLPIHGSLRPEKALSMFASPLGVSVLDQSLFTDITFRFATGETCNAHRVVLSRVDYFKQLFTNGMLESTQSEIIIDDVDYNVFCGMIRYIYTGDSALRSGGLQPKIYKAPEMAYMVGLVTAADLYGINCLKLEIELELSRLLELGNVLQLTKLANTINLPRLLTQCVEFLKRHYWHVACQDDFMILCTEDPDLDRFIVKSVAPPAGFAREVTRLHDSNRVPPAC